MVLDDKMNPKLSGSSYPGFEGPTTFPCPSGLQLFLLPLLDACTGGIAACLWTWRLQSSTSFLSYWSDVPSRETDVEGTADCIEFCHAPDKTQQRICQLLFYFVVTDWRPRFNRLGQYIRYNTMPICMYVV